MAYSSKQSFDTTLMNPINSDTMNNEIDETRVKEQNTISVLEGNIVENKNEPVEGQQKISVSDGSIIENENQIVEEQERSVYGTNIITDDNYWSIKDENGQKIQVTKYTLLNDQKIFIEIINYGATVISCWVPNALGELEDVLLGFDSIESYRLRNAYSVGSTLGRVTDYITGGRMKNDNGDIVELSKNRGGHHFNGGEKAFDKVMWDGYVDGDKLILTYSSKDGEEGYPGTFQIRTTFRLTCKNELVVDYVGMTSKSTPVNISSNMFFNLAGHAAGESEIANHTLMVNADEYVAVKIPERRPIGLVKTVYHTCLDLRVPRLLKKAFPIVPGFGYNHTFKLFKGTERKAFNLAASLSHKPSGRILDVYTDMPCVYVNTAQEFPNYSNTLYKEEVLNVTEILSPSAKFGASGPDQGRSDKDESTSSKSDLEDEDDGLYVLHAPSTHAADYGVHEDVPITGKSNTVYSRHSGICIRPQLFPDAVTHRNFNSVVLKPSNIYSQQTVYKFGVMVPK